MLPALSSPNTAARKEQLQQEAQEYKNKIDTQVITLKTEATKVGTATLVIGGVLLGTYLLFRWLSPTDKKTKVKEIVYDENTNLPVAVKEPKEESWIISSIKGYIMSFLIAIAKDKILEAISLMKESINADADDNNNLTPTTE
ncbi:hypothetical protein [Flectobacillus longus]|uniref:hypothetical protein n=1 Tax=Flectobacillus longus TaxID=2984207 RepID=UPI0024B7BE5D|nr:hypothetical protein [Flectobacillus longus]MDI9881720.1 hypothetical protein [Flectobacillus longus]